MTGNAARLLVVLVALRQRRNGLHQQAHAQPRAHGRAGSIVSTTHASGQKQRTACARGKHLGTTPSCSSWTSACTAAWPCTPPKSQPLPPKQPPGQPPQPRPHESCLGAAWLANPAPTRGRGTAVLRQMHTRATASLVLLARTRQPVTRAVTVRWERGMRTSLNRRASNRCVEFTDLRYRLVITMG